MGNLRLISNHLLEGGDDAKIKMSRKVTTVNREVWIINCRRDHCGLYQQLANGKTSKLHINYLGQSIYAA